MKFTIKICLCPLICLMLLGTSLLANAQDMRVVNKQADKAKAALIAKVAKEELSAQQQATKSRNLILTNRTKLERAIKELQQKAGLLDQEIAGLKTQQATLTKEEQEVSQDLAQTDQILNELVGVIRINAKDFNTLISENHQTALLKDPVDYLAKIGDKNNFPGMDGVHLLADTLFSQIEKTGEVSRSVLPIIDRNGNTINAETLILGPFCAVYRIKGEVGYLHYSSAGRQFYALSKLPSRRMQKQLAKYIDAESDSLPMDITRGAALQQLSYSLSFLDQVKKGGPIAWPILTIFVFGVLIVIERIIFIVRIRFDSDTFMQQISTAALQLHWQECEDYCSRHLHKPVARVINAGLKSRELDREDMENVLQEAILREIPPMERFLSTLGMLAAISPLLGLLGTVTGMIATFHIITLHGTSDPKLMSGGISEALVTTMLGLGVAIPLMLAQTLLNRAVEKEIGIMEEKGVTLVNIIHKSRIETCKA